MVLETITERGVVSVLNSVILDDTINNTSYNMSSGMATAGTINTITLASSGSFTGKVIEILYGTGINQSRLITDISGNVATVCPDWGWIPDSTTEYVIHQNSGKCPTQTQSNLWDYLLLDSNASSIDDFYAGCYIKLIEGSGKGQIFEIMEYNGTSKIIEYTPRQSISPANDTLYVIYGESGAASTGTYNTITFDGNQSSAVKPLQYIELIAGTGQGQIRMINSISGNVFTMSQDWDIIPDNTTKYSVFGGWGSASYENVLRHAIITVSSTINIQDGERSIIEMESSMDTSGTSEIRNITELSSAAPSTAHAITTITEFFRVKFVSMGTSLNGTVQTLINSYKSGKVTSKLEEIIHGHSDCELNRAVIAGKTPGGEYRNIQADNNGNIYTSIRSPTDGFGSIVTIQPRQFAEIMFLNNWLNPANIGTEILNGGSISVANNICSVSSGTNAAGKASMFSLRRMRYNPGLAINVRFTSIFSAPLADSMQIIGYGDCCDGLFVGYNDTNFGILHRRGGKNEIRRLTITAASAADDTITIALNGVSSSAISILATDNVQQIARKIATTSFAAIGTGWDVYEEGATVLFISRVASNSLTGTYSYTPTGSTSAGSFAVIQSGVNATDTWTLQQNWNKDTCLGVHDMPFINFQKGNVFEISIQWLGFGNIIFRIEHPTLGVFQDVHSIRYSNKNTLTSILNPNLPLYAHVKKTGSNSTDSISVQTASMGLFVMGDNNKILGARMGISNWYSTSSGALTGGQYYSILALRNMNLFNNTRNYNELYALGITMCLNSGPDITRGGIFTFFSNAVLDNSGSVLTWTKRNIYVSTVEYCKNIVAITGGNELLSVPMPPNHTISNFVVDIDMFVPPGIIVILAFKPFDTIPATPATSTADIAFSVSWIQR